jgi:acetyl/propionyl-CoA carboxylase alpha subunit
VYSEADRDWPFVADADEAIEIGPGPARQSYLDVERVLGAARRARVDGIHPGYGFLSENWRFAEACARAGLSFVGPTPEAIRAMGDKTEARRLMAAAGLPIVPGTLEPLDDLAAVDRAAREIGFPLLLKAAGGGGGIGMARVTAPSELPGAFATAGRRAQAAFGTAALYLERYLERPRHVEVQILGGGRAAIVHLHERECSIQRRHQKLVEEAPAPRLSHGVREELAAAAVRGAAAIGYTNAGTLEFLVDEGGAFYFLEMNTRLQVEHAVTEEVTGLDLVAAQLRVAAGEPLGWGQEDVRARGASIECRVYAEDPDRGFLPSPGTIARLDLPAGEGIRVESGVEAGSAISVHYDPLLFKLIVRGSSRTEAIAAMGAALEGCRVEGVRTNLAFLRRVLASEAFRRAEVHTQMVEQGAFNA